jgi:hypothetical protein
MKKSEIRHGIWITVAGLLLSALQTFMVPQVASAGSLNFGIDGGGNPTGGSVTIPYDQNLEVGTGAFNLEMWVKETSRNPPGGQYTASFWSSTIQHFYHERGSLTSSFMWGLSFDGPSLFAAWRANQDYFYPAGSNTGITDNQTSNTKTSADVYNTFADQASHHIALSKTGVNGSLSMYLDGVRVLYVANDNQNWSLLGGDVVIGGNKFVGQIGDVRLVKGQALYTGASINVPTSQITTTSQGAAASNVSLLLKSGGAGCGITDYSDYQHQVKIGGVACVNAASRVGGDLRAITSYNLQFDKQGHGTKPSDIGNVNSIAVASLPTISNDGYFAFLGWSATSTGPLLTGTYTATADSTLFAIWQDNSPAPPISTANILLPRPSMGARPLSILADNGQFSATVTWSGSPTIFARNTIYTATITVVPNQSRTLQGVEENFFTVNGNTPTSGNLANAGVLTFTFPGLNQGIYFNPLANMTRTSGDQPIIARSTAGNSYLPILTSNTPSICEVISRSVRQKMAGTCSITASQSGDGTYLPATSIIRSFVVNKSPQTIDFKPIVNMTRSNSDQPITARSTAGEGYAPILTSNTPNICEIVLGSVRQKMSGTCSITASQPGDEIYLPARSVTHSFNVVIRR